MSGASGQRRSEPYELNDVSSSGKKSRKRIRPKKKISITETLRGQKRQAKLERQRLKPSKGIGKLSKSKAKKLSAKLAQQPPLFDTPIFESYNYETQDKKESIVLPVPDDVVVSTPSVESAPALNHQLAVEVLGGFLANYGESIDVFDGSLTLPELINDVIDTHPNETHFAIINLRAVIDQAVRWKRCLPRVQPFYAIKSCPDLNIVRTLQMLGVNFDCASKGEIELALSVGAKPSQIIFANPAKGPDHLLHARERDVRMMTFDNLDELRKIIQYYPDAEVVLRIASNDKLSRLPFGYKFGASFELAKELILECKNLNADLVGISFHVGSGALSSVGFIDTLHSAHRLFEFAREAAGIRMTILDIGGGYPGDNVSGIIFEDLARDIGPVIDELFDDSVTIMAEPGRYFCNAAISMALKVYAKREYWATKTNTDAEGKVTTSEPVKEVQYYVPDGQYGSFNSIMYDHSNPLVLPLKPSPPDSPTENTTFFGPTCDSIDVVAKNIQFPRLELGDWIYCPNMGAYTIAAGSRFNGFERPTLFYRMSLHDAASTLFSD